MWSRGFFLSFNGIIFHSWKELSYNLLTQEHWRLTIFFCILTFYRPPCLKSEDKVSFFIFGLKGHRKVFCILPSSLIISVGTFDINEKKKFFEIVKVLKTITLPSSVRQRIHQTVKTFWILVMLSRKISLFHFSLLYEKWIPVILWYITQINTLHATNCHFHTFKHFNTCNFAFFRIWF